MNSILATEPTTAPEEKRPTLPPLETAAGNERMRHIPSADWLVQKLDVNLRKRIQKLTAVLSAMSSADPRYATIEDEFKSLCRSIDRLSDVARHGRHNGHATDIAAKIEHALADAVAALRSLEATPFGRRNPYHSFERSKSEPVYAALLSVMCHVERIVPLARAVDPGIDERLLEGLVVLQNPVDARMLRPIA